MRLNANSGNIGHMTQSPASDINENEIDISSTTIGVLGGTGEQGRGLATRFALAGLSVIIGSRTAERANEVAGEIGHSVKGMSNVDAALASDLVIVAVPWDGHKVKPVADTVSDVATHLKVDM